MGVSGTGFRWVGPDGGEWDWFQVGGAGWGGVGLGLGGREGTCTCGKK